MGWLTRKRENRYVDAFVITLLVVLPISAGLDAVSGIAASAFLFLVGAGYVFNRYDQRRRQKRLDAARPSRPPA